MMMQSEDYSNLMGQDKMFKSYDLLSQLGDYNQIKQLIQDALLSNQQQPHHHNLVQNGDHSHFENQDYMEIDEITEHYYEILDE